VKNFNEGSTLRVHSSGHSVENKGVDVKERQEKDFRAQGKKTALPDGGGRKALWFHALGAFLADCIDRALSCVPLIEAWFALLHTTSKYLRLLQGPGPTSLDACTRQ